MSLFVVPQAVRDAETILAAAPNNNVRLFLIASYAGMGLDACGDERREAWALANVARLVEFGES